MANYTGYTCDTAQSLLMGSGAYFRNYDVTKDTYDIAMAAGKCLGATKGGGNFSAVPTTRESEIDGMPSGAKGATHIDSWAVTMMANIIEIKPETLKNALGTGVIFNEEEYFKIRARNNIQESDYIDNITWVGRLSGSNEPIIIQIFNAFSATGININPADKSEALLATTFKATSDYCKNPEDRTFAPFAIYYPKSVAMPTVERIFDTSTVITGTCLTGATVHVTGGTIAENTTIIGTDENYSITITKQEAGTEILVYQVVGKRQSLPVSATVEIEDIEGVASPMAAPVVMAMPKTTKATEANKTVEEGK